MSGDIIDRIDELVDDQMAAYETRSGYDYNRAEQRCPHCHRDWHGLAITERLEQMQREYRALDPRDGECDYATSAIVGDYRYSDDDSEVLCPGSTFIGPRRPTRIEREHAEYEGRVRGRPVGNVYDSGWNLVGVVRDELRITYHYSWPNPFFPGEVTPFRGFREGGLLSGDPMTSLPDATTEPEPTANPERWQHLPRLPRPSTRPPMWAARADGRRR